MKVALPDAADLLNERMLLRTCIQSLENCGQFPRYFASITDSELSVLGVIKSSVRG